MCVFDWHQVDELGWPWTATCSNFVGILRLTVWLMFSPVFENTYFSFFLDFKKTWLFTFFEMTLKKRKKSVAKILSSMMLTLLQKRKKVCWMSIGILASKLPDVMGTYRHLSYTVLSCILSCVHTSEQDVLCWWPWTYRYWLRVIE